ncbi:thiamine phosphate synthase [Staphylococcus auricularis]|uniref:thiamine phosphate synthase n=1 Tax=Staphylococcus auricularis TaxID=29379 RepID=UPI001248C065|nr:thiamine phosphate synthase [Staphylococcus auricularis]
MFVAITRYQALTEADAKHYTAIAPAIDYLILRTPMDTKSLVHWVNQALAHGFPKDKLMIHSDEKVLAQCHLTGIHFRESDPRAARYKQQHPDVIVSQATHHATSIQQASNDQLDFVLFGHLFNTASKPGQAPRSETEIQAALDIQDIPIIALGGINTKTINQVPSGFSGIAAISLFATQNLTTLTDLRKAWHK